VQGKSTPFPQRKNILNIAGSNALKGNGVLIADVTGSIIRMSDASAVRALLPPGVYFAFTAGSKGVNPQRVLHVK
jgi:hypothetical protein